MTTPQYPDPNQPPDPSGYQPPPGGYQPPDPSAYQPPSGAYQQPGTAPQPGAYPPPPASSGYPPPDPSGGYPPPGQPGGAYPPPPGAPGMPGLPGEQPKKSNTPRIIIAAIVVVVVVLGIVLYLVNRKSDPDYAKVGDCIKYSSETNVKVVDCGSGDAQYKVVKRIDGTSDQNACDDVDDSDVSLYTTGGGKQYTLCVSLVLAKGDCVSSDGDKVACSSPDAEYKVLTVLTGTTDDSGCPSDTALSRTYKADKQVVCLGKAT